MRKSVLLIEDDYETNALYAKLLGRAGYSSIGCMSAIEGLDALIKNPVDIIVLDLNLPDYSGYEVCTKIRQSYETPIIFVSSETDVEARIKAYHLGADAYLMKPINAEELFAVIEVHLRRNTKKNHLLGPSHKLCIRNNAVHYDQKPIPLTPLEYEITSLLLATPSTTFSREEITSQIATRCSPRSIDYHIKNIRLKLRKSGVSQELIRSVYGKGYRLDLF